MNTERTQNGTGRVRIRDVRGTNGELSHIAGDKPFYWGGVPGWNTCPLQATGFPLVEK